MINSMMEYYLIDYGLSRRMDFILGAKSHPLKGFVGTPRYASVRAHSFLEQSKKDDLESLFYNLAFLYYKRLPWSKLPVSSDKKLEKIKQLKIQHRTTLFHEMGTAFKNAFEYILCLEPFEEPSYRILKGYFKRTRTFNLKILNPKNNGIVN